MKLSKTLLSQATAATMLLAGSTAYAYLPTNNDDGDTVVYWAGASASSGTVQDTIIGTVCDPDNDTVNPATNQTTLFTAGTFGWGVACNQDDGIAGSVTGQRVFVHKRDSGGSAVGVGPVQQWLYIDYRATTPGVNCAVAPNQVRAGETVSVYTCGSTNVQRRPNVGSSDIEPNKFVTTGLNAPSLTHYGCGAAPGAAVTADVPFLPNGAGLSVSPLAQLLFNTPVNLAFYLSLQDAQFGANSSTPKAQCAPVTGINPGGTDDGWVDGTAYPTSTAWNADADGDGIANGEEEECMPSLTKEEIRSLFATRLTSAARLLSDTGGNNAVGNSAFTVPAGYEDRLQICRRTPGSGTQAIFNIDIMNNVCSSATVTPSRVGTGPAACGAAGGSVCEAAGTGDMDNCLVGYNNGTNLSSLNPGLRKRLAIGILSLEGNGNNINPGGGVFRLPKPWRYIKIDGVAPTIRNAHAGDYSFFGEQTFQTLSNDLAPAGCAGASPRPNAAQQAIIDIVRAQITSPARLLEINTGGGPALGNECDQPFHRDNNPVVGYEDREGCWLATPTGANVAAGTVNMDAPVNMFWRQNESCQPPIKAAGTTNGNGMIVTPNPTFTPTP